MKQTKFTNFLKLNKHTNTDMKKSLFKGLMTFGILLFLSAISYQASAQCSAVIIDKSGVEATSGIFCENEPIQFLAKSPGYTTTIKWEYGNGDENATQKDNQYSYSTAGTYTVTFSGTGPAGSCSNDIEITIKPSPEINFLITSLDFQCFEGNEFCFVDNCEASAGSTIDSTIIVFSDGTKKTTFAEGDSFCFSIIDPSGGYFDAVVQTEDANGCVTKETLKDFFYVTPKLGVEFNNITPGPNPGCDSTLGRYKNTSLIPLDSIKRFCWYFGDGDSICGDANTNTEWWDGPAGDGVIEHMYTTHGTFDGKLVVEAVYDCIDSFVWQAAVTNLILDPIILADKDSSCVPDNPVCFRLKNGFPAGVSSFLWNFGDPPSGPANINFRDQEPCHAYGAGQWMITLNIIAGPCDVTVYDTISKIGPGSTIEVMGDRVPQWETYQCLITDSVHFPNNSAFYHNDPTPDDEDSIVFYADLTFGIWRDLSVGIDSIQIRTYKENKLGNWVQTISNYAINSEITQDGYTVYFDNVKDSMAIIYNGDTTYHAKGVDSYKVDPRKRYVFNWTPTIFNGGGTGAGNGDQTQIPPAVSLRGYDPHVWRVWDMGDRFAPQCTTDSRAWVNKNVGINCNWRIDSVPVHWYTPWDEVYREFNDGRNYTRPFTKTLLFRPDTFCYQVNVYPAETMVVQGKTILTVPVDSSYRYDIYDETNTLIDSIELAPGGKAFSRYVNNRKYIVRRPPSCFVGTRILYTPGDTFYMAINVNNDTTYHSAYRLGDDPAPILGSGSKRGSTQWTVSYYDMEFEVPAGVKIDIMKLGAAGGGGAGVGTVRSVTGPKTELIEADEQFILYAGDTLKTVLIIEEVDPDTTYAQASFYYEKELVFGIPTTVTKTKVFVDSAAHREDYFLENANCHTVQLWHQDTVHPLQCESTNTKSLALTPPSARGMEWSDGTPCPLDGDNLEYYLEFDFGEAKPGCTQPWFAVNFDSIADPTNFIASTSGGIFPPPAPPLIPIHALPYSLTGNWPNKIIKGYTAGEIGNDPNLRKPVGSFTVGLIMGNGAPYNDTTWVVDENGDTLTNGAGTDSTIVMNYPAQCLDTFWYNDLFRILYLNADFMILKPDHDPLSMADPKTMCAGDTAWFRINDPIQDSISVLRWAWGYQGIGRGPNLDVYIETFHYYKTYTGPSATRNDKDVAYNGEDWIYNYVIRQSLTDFYGLQTLDTIVTAIIKDWRTVVNTTTLAAKREVEDRFELSGLTYADIPPEDRIYYLGTTGCVDTTGLSQFFTFGVKAYSHRTEPLVYMEGDRRYRTDTTVFPYQKIEVAHILHFRDSSIQGYDTVMLDTNFDGTLDTIAGAWTKAYKFPEEVVKDKCYPNVKSTIWRSANGPMVPTLYLNNTVGCEKRGADLLNVGFLNDFWVDNTNICKGLSINLGDTIRYWQYGEQDPPTYPVWQVDYWHDPVRYLANKEIFVADWDSTDGVWDDERSLTLNHYYPDAGEYTISVVPTDSMGCKDTVYLEVSITDVIPGFTLSNGFLNCVTFVDFVDTSVVIDPCQVKDCPNGNVDTCERIVAWEWDFGDGTRKSLLQHPSHNYTQGGFFDVKLIVWTELGCIDSIVQRIFIPGPQPEFEFDNDVWNDQDSAVICVGDSILLLNRSGGEKLDPSYQVRWGDGGVTSFDTDTTAFGHIYDKVGTFELYLIQFDEIPGTNERCSRIFPDTNPDLENLRKIKVVVLPRAPADISIDDTIVCIDDVVTFTANVDTLYKRYTWDFGDKDTITKFYPDSTVGHAYDTSGTFNIKLIPDYTPPQYIPTCPDTAYATVHVVDVVAAFDIDSSNKPEFCFINTSTGGEVFDWTFNDEPGFEDEQLGLAFEDRPCHNYNDRKGTYEVCLIATSPEGCKDTVCQELVNSYIKVIIPYNVFTPNAVNGNSDQNDDLNNVFQIEGEGFEEYNIKIFNRWGERVFESDNIDISWNGKVNNDGAECPGGTYFYIINYRFRSEDLNQGLGPIEGMVELIR
jgi:gliding motility-associated-like protein